MSSFQIQTGFAPGRVHINQEGQLVVPDNASIRFDGGVNALSEKSGELDQPQIGSPTILRWPISNNSFTFNRVFGFNFYALDAWYLKTSGQGGAGDKVTIQALQGDQSGGQVFQDMVIFDLNGIDNSTIVRPSAFERDDAFQGIHANKVQIPQQIKIIATKATGGIEGIACLMILPYLGNRASFLAP